MLTRKRIIDAALMVVEARGFGALTAREITTELGVSPMALYRHVPSMSELRAEVGDRALADVRLPPPDEPWATRIRNVVAELDRVCNRYAGLPVLEARGPAVQMIERVLHRALEDAGFSGSASALRLRMLVALVIGNAQVESSGHSRDCDSEFSDVLDLAMVAVESPTPSP